MMVYQVRDDGSGRETKPVAYLRRAPGRFTGRPVMSYGSAYNASMTVFFLGRGRGTDDGGGGGGGGGGEVSGTPTKETDRLPSLHGRSDPLSAEPLLRAVRGPTKAAKGFARVLRGWE